MPSSLPCLPISSTLVCDTQSFWEPLYTMSPPGFSKLNSEIILSPLPILPQSVSVAVCIGHSHFRFLGAKRCQPQQHCMEGFSGGFPLLACHVQRYAFIKLQGRKPMYSVTHLFIYRYQLLFTHHPMCPPGAARTRKGQTHTSEQRDKNTIPGSGNGQECCSKNSRR